MLGKCSDLPMHFQCCNQIQILLLLFDTWFPISQTGLKPTSTKAGLELLISLLQPLSGNYSKHVIPNSLFDVRDPIQGFIHVK